MKEKYPHRKGLKLSDIPLDVREIITNLVFETEECIPTIYPSKSDGYGTIQRVKEGKKVRFRTHRVSQVVFNGEVPDGYIVCHSCDNPACINPKHLDVCTDADNSDDKVRKGRQAKGENNGRYIDGRTSLPRPKSTTPFEGRNGRKLNKEQVREIKIRIINKDVLRIIAEDYGVKESVVKDISCGRTYSSVKV